MTQLKLLSVCKKKLKRQEFVKKTLDTNYENGAKLVHFR